MEKKQVAIIGGGPSGLMAAELLARAGCAVTVYDRMPSPGRKLLIAGRGGLNLTHSEPLEVFISRYGGAADWLAPALYAFPPTSLREWCERLGIETFIGTSGRIFPKGMKAVALLRAWLRRLEGLGVGFAGRHSWLGWEGKALRFSTASGDVITVTPDATLLALGGASWPRLGSDGGWYGILASRGVALSPLRPANCGFIVPWSEYFSLRFAGEPLKPVALTYEGVRRQGEALITAQGMEGGVVYAFSTALRDGIEAEGKAEVFIDLRPSMSMEALVQKLQSARGGQSLSTYLRKAGFSSLAVALLREVTPTSVLSELSPAALAARLKYLPVWFTAAMGLDRAISTAGGVVRGAVDEHFMLRAQPGVFVAGEMLDWEAPTGGYLLQGCFSTAVAAAVGAQRYLGL